MAKILIVGDKEAIRLVLSMHLSLACHDAQQAEDAARARALTRGERVCTP